MRFQPKLPGDVDKSVWYVVIAMIGALFLGGVFLVFSIEVSPPAAVSSAAVNAGTGTAAATGTAPAAGAPAPATKPATGTRPAPAATPVRGAAPAAVTTSSAGTVPDPKATAAGTGATASPQAESTRARLVAEEKTRNAARWAGLLWAFACCAVGAFLGFIFGIPRSLSSDTARTTAPAQSRSSENPSPKAAAALAAREKDEAAREVEGIAKQVADAETELTRLRTAAGGGADSDPKVRAASDALAGLRDNKRKADAVLLEKTSAAHKAELLAKKDEGTLPSVAAAGGAARPEPVHARAPSTAVNTNLEQISDWLTKIIVGVSLVNSDRVGRAMLGVADEMANSFGGPGSRSLALAALTYFGVIGLLGGYLLTRLFLQRAFEALGSTNPAEQHPG